VAVKLLHPGLADDEAFLRRFQAEARVVAALRHPNIVRVYDWGDDQGSPFLVMELLEGGSLRSLLDRGQRLSQAQAARIGGDAAKALDYAHRRGLVHRDIKPANLLFDEEGQVSVADFGLARALAEATWTEPVGAMLGTARYAAPEQIGGGALDGKADVYSLALVLVEAVTGKVPFAADTTLGTLMARVDKDLPVTDELGPLAAAIRAAGAAAPDVRSDAASLASALAGAARQLPAPAPLTLATDSDGLDVYDDDPDLTELPGRPKLFDNEGTGRGSRRPDPSAMTPMTPMTPMPPMTPMAATTATAVARSRRARPEVGPLGSPGPKAGKFAPPRRRRRRWPYVLVVALVAAGLGAGALVWSRTVKPSHPVPALINETPAAAAQALAPLHFKLATSSRFDDVVAKGLIVSQGEPANVVLKEGATVAVVVSLGPPPVTVPELIGLSVSDATNRLIGAGLKLGAVSGRYDNSPKGGVLTWSGQGGQLPKGSPVDLVISNGPPVVAVPSVTGGSFGAAQAALAAVSLTAVENDVFSNTVPKGQVMGTSPAAGTSIQVGSKVTVTVSKGPDLVPVTDVHGQPVGAATKALQAAGFNVSGVTGDPTKNVTHTSPAAGAQVLRGSSVTLFTT
jgi:serine/threonine-protein kinase